MFYQSGVRLKRGVVKEVHSKEIILSDGTKVPYGLLVWSTGVGPSKFVKALNLPKSPGGRYVQHKRKIKILSLVHNMLSPFNCSLIDTELV